MQSSDTISTKMHPATCRTNLKKMTEPITRVRKNENFPDSKIFVAKTFRIKRVNCINFQIRDKYA